MKLDNDITYKLYKVIDKSKKVNQEALTEMVDKLNLSSNNKSIFYEYLSLKSFSEASKLLNKHGEELASDFSDFLNLVENSNLKNYLTYDPAIVRGLDYYTGIVFEIFDKHPENRRAICGGGSYADLLKIFDEPSVPGVGFGLGDVTLTDFLTTHKLMKNFDIPSNDLLLTIQDDRALLSSINLAEKLRDKQLKVVNHYETIKFNKVFPLAEKKGASFVAFIGENELNNKTVQLKNMKDKTQHTLPLDNIDEIIKVINGNSNRS